MTAIRPRASGALYYPYINIDNVEWLRANLLIFPCVKRMIPSTFTPRDTYAVKGLTEWSGDQEPLLKPANLFTQRCRRAQTNLAGKLERDARNKSFMLRYGQRAARTLVDQRDHGFQIHAQKLSDDLKEALAGNALAWNPVNREHYDKNSEYVEVHPRVGEAVMSTIAIACAQDDGLDIVGDERSGELHSCLLQKELNRVYESWLGLEDDIDPPQPASGEGLMEFFLGAYVNLSRISVNRLRELADDREAIDDLIGSLRVEAAKIPNMGSEEKREHEFKEAASRILKKWENDRLNLSNVGRSLFGRDATKLASTFVGSVANKTATGLVAGTLTAAGKETLSTTLTGSAANVDWVGALSAGGVFGAAAGLIVGAITHVGL